jgi:hypothetical protein
VSRRRQAVASSFAATPGNRAFCKRRARRGNAFAPRRTTGRRRALRDRGARPSAGTRRSFPG